MLKVLPARRQDLMSTGAAGSAGRACEISRARRMLRPQPQGRPEITNQGVTMNSRVSRHSATLGVIAVLFASGSFAKGIGVDETLVCPSPPIAQMASGQISLGGS